MNFFKVITLIFISLLLASNVFGDNHDTTEKELLEKAKEINQKVKLDQADKAKATPEEPLPLNDPFAGDESLGQGGASVSLVSGSSEDVKKASLYNFKLIGIMTGEYESYVSLINSSGEIITLQMNEELSPGIKLIALQPEKAVFEKGIDSYLHINFKNQIKETSDPF
jgi:hypothetical protein|tara:strand:- start:706 stop:1209 length:504 start_codon:yes stop_codon:yes gene_type:complete